MIEIPKFRAWAGGSVNTMYDPEKVSVCNGSIWVDDEDFEAGEWIENNDLVLMQSTGVSDVQGKEIFEGDILRAIDKDGSSVGVVRFGKNHAYQNPVPAIGFYIECEGMAYAFSDYMVDDDTVIGNIYETPGLLETEK